MVGYDALYAVDSIADVVIDLIVGVGAFIVKFSGLIALVGLYLWVTGRL